jgi:hypothetical protein
MEKVPEDQGFDYFFAANNVYVMEYEGPNCFGGHSHYVVIVAAKSKEVAQEYVKDKIGLHTSAVWLMSAGYPTIWIRNGSIPQNPQAKILYNGTFHTDFNIEE